MSSGVELQVFVPKLHVPLRLYWAYNVVACTGVMAETAERPCNVLFGGLIASPSEYPNNATYQAAKAMFGPQIFHDPQSMLRLAIGFSF